MKTEIHGTQLDAENIAVLLKNPNDFDCGQYFVVVNHFDNDYDIYFVDKYSDMFANCMNQRGTGISYHDGQVIVDAYYLVDVYPGNKLCKRGIVKMFDNVKEMCIYK